MAWRALLASVLLLAVPTAVLPATITISSDGTGDYATLQAAVDAAAAAGDEVVLQPGTYTGDGNRDVDPKGKAITIRSSNPSDPAVVASTVIDCQATYTDKHRAFYVHTAETAATVLAGLTLTNSYSDKGPGVYCAGTSPTIRNCVITKASGSASVYVDGGGTPLLEDCTIANGEGSGVHLTGASRATISRCTIRNMAYNAVFCSQSDPTVLDSVLQDNGIYGLQCNGTTRVERCVISGHKTAAVYCGRGSTVLLDCSIDGNQAGINFGYYDTCSLQVRRCRVRGNTGIGINCTGGSTAVAEISQCLIQGNTNGGVSCRSQADVRLRNCRILGNYIAGYGAGIGIYGAKSVDIRSCTITGNIGDNIGAICSSGGYVTISNSIIRGNSTPEVLCEGGTHVFEYSAMQPSPGGIGMITADPLLTADGHLQAGSPCINTGNPAYTLATDETDTNGEPRIAAAAVDIGADEFIDTDSDALPDWHEQKYFGSATAADASADPDGDGLTNLQEYVQSRDPSTAAGLSFYVDAAAGNDAWDGLTPNFDGVHGPKKTIQAGIDAARPNEQDRVIVAPGRYTGPGNVQMDFKGKIITVQGANPADPAVVAATVIDCQGTSSARQKAFSFHMEETKAAVLAGLMIVNAYGSDSNATGAIECSNASHPTIDRCRIESTGNASAIFCSDSSSPTITRCRFQHNVRSAIRCRGAASKPMVSHCLIRFNGPGTMATAEYGTITLDNCTIVDNCAGAGSPILSTANSGKVILRNCILWNNSASSSSTSVTATYSVIQGGAPGTGNMSIDPLLTDDGRLQTGSACIEAGDPQYAASSGQTDIDGEPVVVGARVDIGADEFLDNDADGLPDGWETRYFGTAAANDPAGDPDGDGLTNLRECAASSDPSKAPAMYYVNPAGNDAWDGLAGSPDGQHGPKKTIQAAIDAASFYNRDQVVLAPAIYKGAGNRDLDFAGKRITVRSSDPADSYTVAGTVLDCEGSQSSIHRGFSFHSFESPESVVDGLTVTNGYLYSPSTAGGGAVSVTGNSNPTLRGCRFVQNQASFGGAVYCENANPNILGCVISGNATLSTGGVSGPMGGGVYVSYAGPTIRDCTILENRSYTGGGLALTHGGATMLDNCTIRGNTGTDGGAIWCSQNGGTIANCRILNNTAGSNAGVYLCGDTLVRHCEIRGNTATATDGGGITCTTGGKRITGCRILGNSAKGYGGGVLFLDTWATVSDCIVAGNTANDAAGIASRNYNYVTINNCTIVNNTAVAQVGGIGASADSFANPTNSIVWGNTPSQMVGDITAATCVIQGGWPDSTGTFPDDPLLTPDGHLQADSPCINAGPASHVPTDAEADADGEPRVTAGRIDIGADELLDTDADGLPDWWEMKYFWSPTAAAPDGDPNNDGIDNLREYARGTIPIPPPVYYVDPAGGDDQWNGLASAWNGLHGPKATIQGAIDAIEDVRGNHVVLLAGTYHGRGNGDIDFRGKAITIRSADPADPAIVAGTIIDCQGSVESPHRGFHFRSAETSSSILAGVTILNGYADEGGAIRCQDSQPTITDCVIRQCQASQLGAGIFCLRSNATIERCRIERNDAVRGGGVYCDSSPWIRRCTIRDNTALVCGAGVFCGVAGSPLIDSCRITGNSCAYGGGVHIAYYSAPRLTNCVLSGNSNYAVYNYSPVPIEAHGCSWGGLSGAQIAAAVYDQEDLSWSGPVACWPSIPDFDGEGHVNIGDLQVLVGQFGATGPGLSADCNNDGFVNVGDLQILVEYWSWQAP